MKRGTINHPKTWRLSRLLGISRRDTLGLLTLLWDFTGQYAPDGCIGRVPDEDIARACEWEVQNTEKLIAALIESGYVDAISKKTGRLRIHDWFDHCEEWVRKRLKRQADAPPETSRQRRDAGRTMDRLPSPSRSRSREPLPEPLPEPEPNPARTLSLAEADPPHPDPDSLSPSGGFSDGLSDSVSVKAGELDPTPVITLPDNGPTLARLGATTATATPDAPSPRQRRRAEAGPVDAEADEVRRRRMGRAKFELAVFGFIGRDGDRKHPKGSPQHEADLTCMREWWDRDIWPEGEAADDCEPRLRQFLAFAEDAKVRGAAIKKPMAWLTAKLRPKNG